MMKEADRTPTRTRSAREIETRNKADQAVYGAEHMLKEMGEKFGAGSLAIEGRVETLKKAVEATTRGDSTRARPADRGSTQGR